MFSVTVERLLLYLFARDPLQRLVCQIWRMSNAMSEESSRERKGLTHPLVTQQCLVIQQCSLYQPPPPLSSPV